MRVDVAIVGGGPAGCSAALALRSLGRTVAIIDAGSKQRPTETAHPALKQLLASLGAESAIEECEPCWGISAKWGQTTAAMLPAIMNPRGHGWFVHRRSFDHHLQRLARESGVHWIEARARVASFEPERVVVECNGSSISASWMIAASGASPWTTRNTGCAPVMIDSLIAIWARLPKVLVQRLLHVESANDGWWYACPAQDHGSIVCFVTDRRCAKELILHNPKNWNELLSRSSLPLMFDEVVEVAQLHVVQVDVVALDRMSGHRWTAVGDAAIRLDPIGSAGTVTALDSGRRAGIAISRVLNGDECGLATYDRWAQHLRMEFERQRTRHYALERPRREDDFWSRRFQRSPRFSSLNDQSPRIGG